MRLWLRVHECVVRMLVPSCEHVMCACVVVCVILCVLITPVNTAKNRIKEQVD